MKRAIFTTVILVLGIGLAGAQTAEDALRYSRVFYQGTSRFMSTAGAFGAVGADFSTLATNPAGLGLYKSSEYTLTFDGMFDNTAATFNGIKSTDRDGSFSLGNIGFVFSVPTGKSKSGGILRRINIGFGVNRQNDFNQRFAVTGPNHTSSMLNPYVDILNSQGSLSPGLINYNYPFDIGLAYNTGLIFYDSLNHRYTNDAPNGGVYQEKYVESSGSMNEFDFSVGGNLSDRVYFGFTIGMPWIRYYEHYSFYETDKADTIPFFKALQYHYAFQTRGTGFNMKAGVIYRPTDWVRIGASIHTPTWFPSLSDVYSSWMQASYDDNVLYDAQYSPEGSYDYRLRTPFRAIGSIAFFIGQYGFVSGEYEYANLNQARYHASDATFNDINDQIKSSFVAPVNLRFGTEWRIQSFRLRGGFAYSGSPFKDGTSGKRFAYSGGAGYFTRHFFVDLAYQFAKTTADYYIYDPAYVNPASMVQRSNNITATIGVRL